MTDNPYRAWVDSFVGALHAGEAIGTVARGEPRLVAHAPGAPKVLIFSPHPDDEMITGALPLRMLQERRCAVIDVAVTLGSRLDRRAARLEELEASCAYIGFGLITPDRAGLEGINLLGRERYPGRWNSAVDILVGILAAQQPDVVFLPNAHDWNATHIGTHHLVVDAMRRLPKLVCRVVEVEFWGAMTAPNLMIESTPADVAALVAALSLHVGEVARNPYHLRLPAWMMDNVRRGAELVGGQGGAAPRFPFATLYRLLGWKDGDFYEVLDRGQTVTAEQGLESLFPNAGDHARELAAWK
jgi:LmbE family N-acetylglucosaminyl deacetylase